MASEVSATHGTTSYKGLTKQQRIAKAGKILCGSYRIDQFADAGLFALQCAVLFEKYEVEVVEYLTNVVNPSCLQLRYKFPPSLQEIGEALEEETVRRVRLREQEKSPKPTRYMPRPIDNRPGARANVFISDQLDVYHSAVAWTRSPEADPCDYLLVNGGIKIAYHVYNSLFSRVTRGESWRPFTDAEMRAAYGKAEAESHASE